MLTLWSAAAGCNNRMPMCIGSFSLHSKWIGLSKRYPQFVGPPTWRREWPTDREQSWSICPLLGSTVIDGAHYLSVVSEIMNNIPHLSIMLSLLCVTDNKVTGDLSSSGIHNALPNSHPFNWVAYILYYCILYYTFIAKLHIMLYLFFYILHLYNTGIVKLFKNTFIFDIFCGAWSQKCGATLWHNCLECLFLFLLKKIMYILQTFVRQIKYSVV